MARRGEWGGGGYQHFRPPESSWPGSQGLSRGRGPAWATAEAAPGPSGWASGSCARWSNEWTSEDSETTWDWCPGDFEERTQRREKKGGNASESQTQGETEITDKSRWVGWGEGEIAGGRKGGPAKNQWLVGVCSAGSWRWLQLNSGFMVSKTSESLGDSPTTVTFGHDRFQKIQF